MVTTTGDRLIKLARQPKRLPAAVVRRILPHSPTFGFQWVHLPDGSVTFREHGFVSAPSPSMLLARHNYEVSRIHRELSGHRHHRSLEIGCGFGRLSMAIAEHSDSHVGIDINPSALTAARRTYPHLEFQESGAMGLPFPDGWFDLIVSWTVLQHIRPERIREATDEIRRVLAPGGLVLLCEETRCPEETGGHTWHRTVDDYRNLLAPLVLHRHSMIEEISALPGLESPGEVMVFARAD